MVESISTRLLAPKGVDSGSVIIQLSFNVTIHVFSRVSRGTRSMMRLISEHYKTCLECRDDDLLKVHDRNSKYIQNILDIFFKIADLMRNY